MSKLSAALSFFFCKTCLDNMKLHESILRSNNILSEHFNDTVSQNYNHEILMLS